MFDPAHHSPTAVVVKVHHSAGVLHHQLLGVHEVLGKFDAEFDVVTAAAPVEAASVVAGLTSLSAVAAAVLQLPLAAGPGNGIDYTSRGDGVHKRCLSAAWVVQGKRQEFLLDNKLFVSKTISITAVAAFRPCSKPLFKVILFFTSAPTLHLQSY